MQNELTLAGLNQSLGRNGTLLDAAAGVLHVPLPGGGTVELRLSADGALCLRAVVAPLPAQNGLAACLHLLDANLFAERSGGGAFALDHDGQAVLLRHVAPGAWTGDARLRDLVERFAAAVAAGRAGDP